MSALARYLAKLGPKGEQALALLSEGASPEAKLGLSDLGKGALGGGAAGLGLGALLGHEMTEPDEEEQELLNRHRQRRG